MRSIASNACRISAISRSSRAPRVTSFTSTRTRSGSRVHVRSTIAPTLRSCSRAGSSDSSTSRIAASSAVHVSRKIVSRSSSFEEK